MTSRSEQLELLNRLIDITEELREKCPWDKNQTFGSLRNLTIEETYELSEAILSDKLNEIKNELGDLFFHILFYSKIASENNFFDFGDVIKSISKKLVNRHPHIYGNISLSNSKEVKRNWEELKLNEGKKSILEGVPNSLPSLVKTQRVQDKVSAYGFNWKKNKDFTDKIFEEIKEFNEEVIKGKLDNIEDEFGDILFSLINYARNMKIDSSKALDKTNRKFIKRFKYLEKKINSLGKKITDLSSKDLEKIWEESKNRI
ncbi:MAG: nucleoside triphosphate pyrophosphohydrolase [Flavobacteriaceae bacterium]|nr:nucleoside triphosphate pyrophosphohydrolase [Flavobacteriaceae bacterium]